MCINDPCGILPVCFDFSMEIKNQVCSFALATRLKELGACQLSYFVWARMWGENSMGDRITFNGVIPTESAANNSYLEETLCSAFTVAELGEILVGRAYSAGTEKDKWACRLNGVQGVVTADTEADARAKMLVYLLENNLIS